jgi:hypothetical protein
MHVTVSVTVLYKLGHMVSLVIASLSAWGREQSECCTFTSRPSFFISFCKRKAVPLHAMEVLARRGDIAPTHSWSLCYIRVSGQRHAQAALYPGERNPGTPWIGGWVGLRAGLDTEARRKILFLCRGSSPGPPFCSQTLYWLSSQLQHVGINLWNVIYSTVIYPTAGWNLVAVSTICRIIW